MAEPGQDRKDVTEVQAEEARVGFADLLSRVGYTGERILITRYGKPLAALVSMEDFDKVRGKTVRDNAA